MIAILVVVLSGLVAAALVAAVGPGEATERGALLLSGGVATILGVLLHLQVRFPRRLGQLLGWRPPTLRAALVGAGHGLLAFAVINIAVGALLTYLSAQLGFELPEVQEQLRDAAADPALAPVLVFVTVLVGPLAEELFFRGVLFQMLRQRIGWARGAWLSGVLFALVHGHWLAILLFIPLGAYLGWLFHRTGSLLTPLAAHVVFNLLGVAALLDQVA
ncbi:MAG TPA: CPBP family intramembrane glutamic endopeptidase [Egibacteraceae bacterium]|nr:CPBP family intramembrane glutamic endopeptidase [Egibacteraceae bacterium]